MNEDDAQSRARNATAKDFLPKLSGREARRFRRVEPSTNLLTMMLLAAIAVVAMVACSGGDSSSAPTTLPVHVLPEADGCNDLANTASTIQKTYTALPLTGTAGGGSLESGIYELVSDTATNPGKVGTTTKIQLTIAIDAERGLLYSAQSDDTGSCRYNSTLQRSGNTITLRHTCPSDSSVSADGHTANGSLLAIIVRPQSRELAYTRR